jgi:orotate phosphoribosyltransferase
MRMASTSQTTDHAHETARILLRLGAVSINTQELFVYASGTRSPIYCDNRILVSYPDEREQIVGAMTDRIVDAIGADRVDVVSGTATSGIPWAAWVAARLHKPMIYVRPEAKGHGRGKQIEGRVRPGRRVAAIEDLVSTGGSSLATINAVRADGGVVTHCFAIFTYGLPAALRAYEDRGVTLVTLSSVADLLEVGVVDGTLSEDDRGAVLEWLARQPQG